MAQETALVATFAIDYDVRIIKIGEEFWFAAVDVCKILDLKNPTKVLKNLDNDEKQIINLKEYPNYWLGYSEGRGNPNVNFVNESGLYNLIFQSRKPEAKKFKRWVFHDVLPQIRKTGSYTVDKKKTLLKDFKPTGTARDIGTVTNILDDNNIKYDYDITAITFEYNEELGRVCQTYNIELKLVD